MRTKGKQNQKLHKKHPFQTSTKTNFKGTGSRKGIKHMEKLLEKAIIGEAITNYFAAFKKITILTASVYAENRQGKVIAFDGVFCWEITYRISSDKDGNYIFETIDELTGIMRVYKKEEKKRHCSRKGIKDV